MAGAVSNHRLHALLATAGYARAHGGFARQVNLRGRTDGLHLQYDAASVYWWLRGRCPIDPVPQLIADVLGRRIGRPVSRDELGFPVAGASRTPLAGLGLSYLPDLDGTRTTVADLWHHHATQPESLVSAPYVPAATAEAGWRWHFDARDQDTAHCGSRRVTRADINALRGYQQQFLDLDRRHGGGHFRTVLADWLHREVTPMLHGTYTDRVGRHLFTTVAELTGQLAFMSYDIGEHGIAQRHFIQALRLAKAADHTMFGAHVLANLSTQAVYLHQPGEAVRLARAAVDAGRSRRGAAVSIMARLHTAEACAHAIAGDLRSCTTALRSAEAAIGGSGHPGVADVPAWAGYFTTAHLAGTAIRCLRDLNRPQEALRHADQAMALADGSTRTRALHTALIATVYATGPAAEPEHASQLGHDALDLAAQLRSHRVTDRITELVQRLTAHRGTPAVDAFLHRANGPVGAASPGKVSR